MTGTDRLDLARVVILAGALHGLLRQAESMPPDSDLVSVSSANMRRNVSVVEPSFIIEQPQFEAPSSCESSPLEFSAEIEKFRKLCRASVPPEDCVSLAGEDFFCADDKGN